MFLSIKTNYKLPPPYNKKHKILLLIFFVFIHSAICQVDIDKLSFIKIKQISTKKAISSIVQDQFGTIWIGTHGSGLYRFDGVNCISYTYNWNQKSSINSNIIHSIFIDDSSRLWVGTDSGLNLYNRNSDKFEKIDFKLNNNLDRHYNIINIVQDDAGNLLVAMHNALLKIKLEDFSASIVENENENILINDLAKDKNGNIFIGTGNYGLMTLDEYTNSLKKCDFLSSDLAQLSDLYIQSLMFDEENKLWIGTESNGLIKMSKEDEKYKIDNFPITNKKILSILSVENKVLIGTENDGLLVINPDGSLVEKYLHNRFDGKSISANSIWSLYLDKQNRIWLGYYDSGVGVYDKMHNKFEAKESIVNDRNSLQTPLISDIKKDKHGMLWVSMEKTIDILNPNTMEVKHVVGGNNDEYLGLDKNLIIESIFIDSKENFWVGTWEDGLFLLKKGTKRFINYNTKNTQGAITTNAVRGFAEDSNGRIWIASFLKGIHYYDPSKGVFIHCDSDPFVKTDLINCDTQMIMPDSQNNIWVGTTSGLYKVNENDDGTFSVSHMRDKMPAKAKDHPSIHQVISLYESKDGRLWVGTNGGGLLYYNREEDNFQFYNDLLDIKETSINAITESDDGSLWVTGKTGITRIDLKNKKSTNFNTDDGLLTNFFKDRVIEKDENGIIYFGSNSGIDYINPNEIKINKNEPSLYFTNFKLFNKTVSLDDKNSPLKKVISQTESISLTHDQSVFTIEYMGLSHTRPEKNEYAYKLEGLDTDWNYVGHLLSATYTKLEAGNYTFKVKSSNNDGIWNKSPLELKICILPPWWETNLAYTIYGLLFLLTIFGINLFIQQRFKQKQAVELEREKRLQEEILNKKKLQFFTNISHEFRTPLTLIINPLKDIINKSSNLPDSIKHKHKIIHKNAERLSRLINELMDFRKLESNKIVVNAKEINIISYVKVILSYFEEEAVHRKITLHFDSSLDELKSWIDPEMLEKILFNILSNAFKVTPDKGHITVCFKKGEDMSYQISVTDTGPGMDQKEYKRIFKRFYQVSEINKSYYGSTGIGLEMVKNFVELNKGEITVSSKLNEGTTFTVTFPLGKNHFSNKEMASINNEENINLPITVDNYKTENLQENFVTSQFNKKEKSVLIVEDNPDLRSYLKNELKNKYLVITAEDGQKGLELAKKKIPDIIITDVMMPIMDGIEFCKAIKADLQTSHIPLLMLTAKTMVEDKIQGIDSGADAYLNKPFNTQVLKSTLVQLLVSRKVLFDKYNNNFSTNTTTNVTSIDKTFIQKVLDYVNEHISEEDLSVELIASEFFLSRSQFYRKIKALTGFSANEFIRKIRLEKAKTMLESSNYNVNEVAYKVGFSSQSYFTKCFKKEFGHLPTFNKR